MAERKFYSIKKSFLSSALIGLIGLAYTLPAHGAYGRANIDLERRVSRLESMLQNQLNVDNLNKIDLLQQELQGLRGQIEEQDFKIKLLTKKQFGDTKINTNSSSSNQVQDNSNIQANAVPANKTAALQDTGETLKEKYLGTKVSIDAEGLSDEIKFKQAENALLSKDYDNASVLFSSFLWEYPDSKYVPEAYFWLGEINLTRWKQDNSNQTAIEMSELTFARVVKLYSEHEKARDAMLKLGFIAEQQGKNLDAKKYYEKIIKEYPDSSAANVARNKLKKM